MKNFIDRIRSSPFAFPLAAAFAIAMLLVSEVSYRQSRQAFDDLNASSSTRARVQRLLIQMVDAETGQRGYLLTGRREYLEPYRNAVEGMSELLSKVRNDYADEPEQSAMFAALSERIAGKLSEMTETIRLYDEGRTEAWESLLLSNIGQDAMDAARSLAEQLIAREANQVVALRARVADSLMINRVGVGLVTLLALVALFLYLRQARLLERQRHDQARAIQNERDRLEVQVTDRTAQLTELARHLQTVREDERHRLARELHDELGALLTTAKLDVARIKARVAAAMPEAAERLQHLSDTLNTGIALKRRIIEDLRPSSLTNLGLTASLEILLREYRERTGLQVESRLDAVRLAPDAELTVYRLVQEALTNVAKYAKARRLEVSLSAQGTQAEISVRDDGVGFDPRSPKTAAHGLLGMRYRVESEGGQFSLQAAPGRGTCVSARLPQIEPISAA